MTDAPRGRRQPTEGVSGGPMLPTHRVDSIPAGKAPQRGAAAVKASYLPLPLVDYAEALVLC